MLEVLVVINDKITLSALKEFKACLLSDPMPSTRCIWVHTYPHYVCFLLCMFGVIPGIQVTATFHRLADFSLFSMQ